MNFLLQRLNKCSTTTGIDKTAVQLQLTLVCTVLTSTLLMQFFIFFHFKVLYFDSEIYTCDLRAWTHVFSPSSDTDKLWRTLKQNCGLFTVAILLHHPSAAFVLLLLYPFFFISLLPPPPPPQSFPDRNLHTRAPVNILRNVVTLECGNRKFSQSIRTSKTEFCSLQAQTLYIYHHNIFHKKYPQTIDT
jgi:hypothetical protein